MDARVCGCCRKNPAPKWHARMSAHVSANAWVWQAPRLNKERRVINMTCERVSMTDRARAQARVDLQTV